MRDGLIVGCVHNRHKIVTAQHGVLRYDLATELRDLLVHRIETLGILVESLTALGSQRTEQDVGRHYFYLLSSDNVARPRASRWSRVKSSLAKLSRKCPHPEPICISPRERRPAFRWYRHRRGFASRTGRHTPLPPRRRRPARPPRACLFPGAAAPRQPAR